MAKKKVVGAPRKYETPAKLQNAVNKYFASISRETTAKEKVPTGKTDKKGNPIYEEKEIINALGEPLTITEYIVKPTVAGLCTYLHIVKDTWCEYAKRPEYAAICAAAKLEMERDRSERLGGGKGDHGIEFDLKHNFGWKDQITIEAGEETRKVMAEAPATMEEKLKMLRDMGLKLPGEADDND